MYFLRFLALFLIISTSSLAQEWRSKYYPVDWMPPHEQGGLSFLTDSFIQDFSYAGYHRGERALPVITDGLVNVVTEFGADPTGETDTTTAIQAAIEQVISQGGGVVYLPAGTFKVSRQEGENYCLLIDKSHVVLRGAGKDKTFILNSSYEMRSSEVIRVRAAGGGSWSTMRSSPIPIVQDYPGPTMEVKVSVSRLFKVGDWIVVHTPATDDFITEINMAAGSDGVSWLGKQSNLQGQRWFRQVKGVDGNNLILDAPIRWLINTRDSPVVYKAVAMVSEVGLEDFAIGNQVHPGREWGDSDYTNGGRSAWDVHGSWLIGFTGVANGWIRSINSYGPGEQNVHLLSNGVLLRYSRGVTLYRVSMTNAQYGGGGGNGYMIRLSDANECMVVESEVGFCRHGIVQWRMGNSGNVFIRNNDHDTGFQWGNGTGSTTSGKGSDHHGLFSVSNLFDSNVLERSFFEAAYRGDWGSDHGMTASQVVYWNTEGREYWKSNGYIVHTQQFGQGYVIGTSGVADAVNTYEKRPGSAVRTDPVDFVEGEGEGDMLVPESLYLDQIIRRIGNLDSLVYYTVIRSGDKIGLEWKLPPGLQCAFEASDDLELWSQYIDIPEADGNYESSIPAWRFFRIIQK